MSFSTIDSHRPSSAAKSIRSESETVRAVWLCLVENKNAHLHSESQLIVQTHSCTSVVDILTALKGNDSQMFLGRY